MDFLETSLKYYARCARVTSSRVSRCLPPIPIANVSGFAELGVDTFAGLPPQRWSFDEDRRQVLDELKCVVGTFCDDAISSDAFPQCCFASDKNPTVMECIQVLESEIMEAIQDPTNESAWFVLPSQFNGAEFPSDRFSIGRVDKLHDYTGDRSAGPRGQLAVHPAVAQFLLDNAAREDRDGGINALDALLPAVQEDLGPDNEYGVFLRNGYLGLPKCEPLLQDRFLSSLCTKLHTMRCLGMRDVPACGLAPSLSARSMAMHKVNLIYASAVPVHSYLNNGNPAQKPFQQEVGRLLNAAQYYGALQLAAKHSPLPARVFLLPLGGGAFKNSPESIASAMSEAVEWFAADLPQGVSICERLEIHVLTWKGKPEEAAEFTKLLQNLGKLRV